MKTNIRIFLLCSVPEDQKPIQEYLAFQENSLFNWITLTKKEYQKKILFFIFRFFPAVLFLRCLFTPLAIFRPSILHGGQLFQQVLSEGISAFQGFKILEVLGETIFSVNLGVCFFLGLLFFRCREIYLHFFEPRLVYEEASWYDGQIWEKPFALLKNDRLISTQRLQPILKRLMGTLAFFLMVQGVLFFSFW